MALNSFYNAIAAGVAGGFIAHALPGAVDSFWTAFDKAYNKAQAEQRMKPWSSSQPRTDAPGTYTLYSFADDAIAFGVYRDTKGKMDRDGRPALKVMVDHFQKIIAEGWYKDGKLHREDGPALVQYDPITGKATCEEWFFDGEPALPWQHVSTASECQIPLGPTLSFRPL